IPTRFASVDGFWNLCGPGSPIPIEVQGRHAAPTETDTLETVPVSDRKSVQTFRLWTERLEVRVLPARFTTGGSSMVERFVSPLVRLVRAALTHCSAGSAPSRAQTLFGHARPRNSVSRTGAYVPDGKQSFPLVRAQTEFGHEMRELGTRCVNRCVP